LFGANNKTPSTCQKRVFSALLFISMAPESFPTSGPPTPIRQPTIHHFGWGLDSGGDGFIVKYHVHAFSLKTECMMIYHTIRMYMKQERRCHTAKKVLHYTQKTEISLVKCMEYIVFYITYVSFVVKHISFQNFERNEDYTVKTEKS
jgi:hypothetical protein